LNPNPSRREPKKDSLFSIIRVAGLLSKAVGFLLFGIGLIGSVIMLFRLGPGLLDAVQHLDQQFAGFFFLILVVNELVVPFIGLLGLILIGAGFGLGLLGTEPCGSVSIIKADQRA
jgi:hypothetical protein